MRFITALVIGLCAAQSLSSQEFRVTSTDVEQGKTLKSAQVFNGMGCTGQNTSPALAWSGAPAGTKSFAITMYDPDAPTGSGWWHWTVFNIPASVHSLPAGAGDDGSKDLPTGAIQGRTDFAVSHYGGPCPPIGAHAHHYEITVYALKVDKLPLDSNATGAAVGFNLHANMLASAKIVGRYGR